jgi:pimeloyl-ACP methyl ester carboxylesterase
VVGENDVADLLRMSEFVATRIPAVQHIVLPDTAHLPAMEHPAQTLALLRAHLAGTRR